MDDDMDVLCHKVFGDQYHRADLLDGPLHDLLDAPNNADLLGDQIHDQLDYSRANTEPQDLPHHEPRDERNNPLFDEL